VTEVRPTNADLVNAAVRLRGQNLKEFARSAGLNYQRLKNVLSGSDTSSVLRAKIEAALGQPFWSSAEAVTARQALSSENNSSRSPKHATD